MDTSLQSRGIRQTFPSAAFHIYIGFSVLFYAMVYTSAPMAIVTTAVHDDGLYMSLGQYLANGQWLGPFGQFTLMKGPGYPAFLAFASWIGIPVSLAHALFHGAAVSFAALRSRRFIAGYLVPVVLFTLLLWHPIFLTSPFLRVTPDVVFSDQSLIFVVALASALLIAPTSRERVINSVFSGLILGWLWLTREEAIWVLSGISIVALAALWNAFNDRRLGSIFGAIGLIVLTFITTQVAFQAINWRVYGKFVGVDVKEKNFQRALGAIQSVRSGPWRPFVAVTGDTMERIYPVSPSFALLRPQFDGPLGATWKQASCEAYLLTCGDIGSGWFFGALRDAASANGFYRSPATASAFFGKVADEISAACAQGELACSPQLISEMPYYTWSQLAQLPSRHMQFLRLALLLNSASVGPWSQRGKTCVPRGKIAVPAPSHPHPVERRSAHLMGLARMVLPIGRRMVLGMH